MRLANTIYNQLSDGYGKLFIKNINHFCEQAKRNSYDKKYTVFYPSFGVTENEPCDFLIYGQAVNGGNSFFNFNKAPDFKKLLTESIEWSNSYFEGHTPLDWVNVNWSKGCYTKELSKAQDLKNENQFKNIYPDNDYNTFRSFFWNVTHKLICRYYEFDENESWEWTKKMVWSNLYKISPADKGNPNDKECEWQVTLSAELVKQEIDKLKPAHCIVMTNDEWWMPFREKLNTKPMKKSINKKYIEAVEQYNDSTIIITKRPYVGNSKNMTDELFKLIK